VYASQCADSRTFLALHKGQQTLCSEAQFKSLTANWHRVLTGEVLTRCLASEDYMQIKNALLVLNRTAGVYPTIREDAVALLKALGPVRESDPREDLKTLARMYATGLEVQLRGGKLVGSRSEYAGLPPPKKKKVTRPPRVVAASPAVVGDGEGGGKTADVEGTRAKPPHAASTNDLRKPSGGRESSERPTERPTARDGGEQRDPLFVELFFDVSLIETL
jgi:hypothetical protein